MTNITDGCESAAVLSMLSPDATAKTPIFRGHTRYEYSQRGRYAAGRGFEKNHDQNKKSRRMSQGNKGSETPENENGATLE